MSRLSKLANLIMSTASKLESREEQDLFSDLGVIARHALADDVRSLSNRIQRHRHATLCVDETKEYLQRRRERQTYGAQFHYPKKEEGAASGQGD